MPTWTPCSTIHLDADLPLSRRYADIPDHVIDDGRRLLASVLSMTPRALTPFADLIRLRTRGRFHAEARAIAARAGKSWRSVMLANIGYDLAISFIGCSTMVLPTPDGPILARNMDWWPADVLAQTSYVIETSRNGNAELSIAGWPGSIGVVSGLSHRGFAIVINAVGCTERTAFGGYPVLLHARRVLEDAADFDEALALLRDQKLVTSCLFTLVGTENHQRVVIERTPRQATLRTAPRDAPLIATNDYRTSDRIPADMTCMRFDRLMELLQEMNTSTTPTAEQLLYMLTDQDVIQLITAQHVVIHPRSRRLEFYVPTDLLNGSPSTGPIA